LLENISFKDVRFSYIADEEVIKGIDLEVQSGQTIAIVVALQVQENRQLSIY
jgi:subfamily B ATP-binding cassette protein MsbA